MLGQVPALTTPEKPVLPALHPRMRLHTRPEVWFLLIASAAAAWWALREPAPYDTEALPSAAGSAEVEAATLRVQRCILTRDVGNARLDIEFHYENRSPRPFFMQPPDVRLLTGDGKEVSIFILPSEKPARIAENAAADLRLRFWLEKEHLLGPLSLEVRGQTAKVKSAAPLALDSLPDAEPVTWTTTEWKR